MLAYILLGYDFGYAWPWTYGHLYLAILLALLAWAVRKRLPVWATAIIAAGALWAFAGFLIVHYVFFFNAPPPMPTQRFMTSGQGRVLDIGCGSGRTSIMVGTARPKVLISALDNFSATYIRGNGEDLLRRNLRIAGIDSRVQMLNADMRRIPAPDASFDGVVSSYAIDHLSRAGIEQTLGEVSRVLRPGGEFLLEVIRADGWVKFTYGPLLVMHMRRVEPGFWTTMLERAHLNLIEQGTTPGSAYFLCRKT